ncbi:MAG: glutathione peroxidase [Alphaproteobacteria bacterium]|nr:glutathione peroxidase [Alphaproteobacteria bacterium]
MSKTAHDFSFTSIEGQPLPMASFKGKAVLIVNTASQCGLTPQYEGLQALWDAYKDKGLVVLGVPSNDFGQQEPGSEAEVQTFCQKRFGVTFPLTTKQPVIGGAAHPFYQWVAQELGEGAAPKWNFHKYLIGKDGSLKGTFGSMVVPEDAGLRQAIDEAVA